MTDQKSTVETYIENLGKRRIFEEERLLVNATELLAAALEASGTKKGELADRLGCSKSHVTQMLRGNRNLTLRTLADVFCVLNYRLLLDVAPLVAGATAITCRPWSITQRAGNVAVTSEYTPDGATGGLAA